MTNGYEPEAASAYEPLLYGSGLSQIAFDKIRGAEWRSHDFPRTSKWYAIARISELRISELRGGLGRREDVPFGYNRVNASTAHHLRPRQLIAPPAMVTVSGASNSLATVHTNLNAHMFYGYGRKLYQEDSAGTVTDTTYDPGALDSITMLATGVIGGVATARRMFIGRSTGTVQVVSDGTPGTVDGSMNASLAGCNGMAISPLNASANGTATLCFLANGGMWLTPISAAIGAAPTQTMFNIQGTGQVGGSFMLGNEFEQLPKNIPLRGFFAEYVSQNNYQVFHFNGEGKDRQPLPFKALGHLRRAGFWRRHVWASDGQHVHIHDGDTSQDIGVLSHIDSDSNNLYSIEEVGVTDGDIIALVLKRQSNPSYPTNAYYQYYKYLPEVNYCIPCSAQIPASIAQPSFVGGVYNDIYGPGFDVGTRSMPSMPYSRQTSNLYMMSNQGTHVRQPQFPSGIDIYNYRYNGSAGLQIPMEVSSQVTSLMQQFPVPMGRYPSVLVEIDASEADLIPGGAGAKLRVEVATQTDGLPTFTNDLTWDFNCTDNPMQQHRYFPQSPFFNTFQYRITHLNTNGASGYNFNAAPISFRFLTFMDGVIRNPVDVYTALMEYTKSGK